MSSDKVEQCQKMLEKGTSELIAFLSEEASWTLSDNTWMRAGPFERLESAMRRFQKLTQDIDRKLADDLESLKALQKWFREQSDPIFQKSPLMTRARAWPEGYPGDYYTLEYVYSEESWAKPGIGYYLDQYFLSSQLAIAVRSRLRKLANILNHLAKTHEGAANWLNLACGSCRELLSVPSRDNRTIWCVDLDKDSLYFAEKLLKDRNQRGEIINYRQENAFRLINPRRNIQNFGELTAIYSVGLFDYIEDAKLIRLLKALYDSLAEGGALIASFKDMYRYDTFDYHWLVKWDFFFQRSEPECFSLFDQVGVPSEKLTMMRDDSGVILFFIATR